MQRIKNISGKRFGRLTAVRPTDMRRSGNVVWECKCDCGSTCYVARNNLQLGKVKSCGCLVLRENITGKRFGKLTAIRPTNERNKSGSIVWECRCDCGNTCYVAKNNLQTGKVKSCGCLVLGENITGKRFGRLIAVRPTNERNKSGSIVWECKCDCGNTCYVARNNLQFGKVKSCGCLAMGENITGKRFGKLTAIRPTNERNKSGSIVWECKCDCGNSIRVPKSYLVSGRKKSCGCLRGTNRV